jgi:NUP50 (Nucleoporin 50 kDa)
MKRGAESQLTKDEFEDGNVELEARLVDPVDTTRFHSSSIQSTLDTGFKKAPDEILKTRAFVIIYYSRLSEFSNQQETEYVGCRTGPSPLVLSQTHHLVLRSRFLPINLPLQTKMIQSYSNTILIFVD